VSESPIPSEITFGRFVIQARKRQVLVDGEPAKLGARAFDLLMALIERRERIVSKNELLDVVWPDVVVEENNLQVQVASLRKLLGLAVIATIPGRGYRFTGTLDYAEAPSHKIALDTPPAAPGNLPQQLSPLIGRDDDLCALVGLIETHPLVTVVGAPGIGKTTLGRAAAHVLRERWSDGAWMVELANITDPAKLPQAVAQALRITLSGAASPQDQLVDVLQSRTLLLVLDNCEHVIEAAGALTESIGAHAPAVRLLATSQELLNVPRERLFKLRPLTVPAADEPACAEHFGALRLFVERARGADPGFALSTTNAAIVAEICRRLDGLPLAIELAAARVRVLGVQGVRERLGERFRMLTGGARTAMRRHQTLQAAIDWSHALLSPEEQTVLRRLGVFVGGFTLELAQEVAGDERIGEWAVLDALCALVDKSLVAADAGEPPRYQLLETMREYALEKLADAGETVDLIERHAGAVYRLLFALQTKEEGTLGGWGTLSKHEFMRRLAPEFDNVRAALDWAIGKPGDVTTAAAQGVAARFDNAAGPEIEVNGATRAAGLVSNAITRGFLRQIGASTVLWVDDRPTNNQLERLGFEAFGISIVPSTSTADALDKLGRQSFDVIISDMGRPPDPRAGYSLLEKLLQSGNKTPFVIYTASPTPDHVLEARRRGALGCTARADELFQLVFHALLRAERTDV
jgi:predicted ATPase/DNA-binding winged helix-turn-helix (wHTH) protein